MEECIFHLTKTINIFEYKFYIGLAEYSNLYIFKISYCHINAKVLTITSRSATLVIVYFAVET